MWGVNLCIHNVNIWTVYYANNCNIFVYIQFYTFIYKVFYRNTNNLYDIDLKMQFVEKVQIWSSSFLIWILHNFLPY